MNDDISAEIKRGESSNREFKCSLRWNVKAKKNDEAMTVSVLRTIAGFLNGSGGVLFIGVDDDGNVTGIAPDNYKTDDGFTVALFNFIRTGLGAEVAGFVDANVRTVNEQKVCCVECKPSPNPVFLSFGDEKDAFFVRTGPTTTKLPGSKVHLYIKEHWSGKPPVSNPRVILQYVPGTDTKYDYFVFRNVGDATAHNIRTDINVGHTEWRIHFATTDVLERGASIEVVPSASYEGRPILKEKFEGDFRLLMKGIYVRRAEELKDSSGGEGDVMRTYLRHPHTTDFEVTYSDLDGRGFSSRHRLTYDPSKHSAVIQLVTTPTEPQRCAC